MYKKISEGWRKHLDFIILDILCLHISFILACKIRNISGNPYQSSNYFNVLVVLTLLSVVVIIFCDSLKNVLKRGIYKEFVATFKHVVLVALLLAFYLFSTKTSESVSRVVLYIFILLYGGISFCVRIFWKNFLRKHYKEIGMRSLVIVTTEAMVGIVVKNIIHHNYEGFRIAGIAVVDKDITGAVIQGVPVVAGKDDVIEYVCREWVDEVFINFPKEAAYPTKLIDQFAEMGVVVHMKLMKTSEFEGRKQFVERLGNYTVLTTSVNYATPFQVFVKRIIDICGGLVGCLITGILFLILAPMIYKESPGPIFFKQVRVGKNGKQFKMYKFRSMYMDAEERKKELMAQNRVKDGMMFKLDWDPRIIGSKMLPDGTTKKGIGNIIRDWSLDEFPQFINVLKGDMSVVGTRPPTVDEWEKYELHHRVRLAMKPGVTGMWQVSGRSNITDFEEVVKLDTQYISQWNLGLDIKIIFKTVAVVFKKEGSM
ncbi:MAG: sugar transferase [Frisingicoccus sp.]|uniref:sugar transferase n=1 Tax=Frisingicoccus sp. TaxID=1918627 RepID=UPI002A7FD4BC|nr:sugar transferase [Frisingicoccus sp.]MDY4833867.1 sugar transferase [Frisingicoccus sp.]